MDGTNVSPLVQPADLPHLPCLPIHDGVKSDERLLGQQIMEAGFVGVIVGHDDKRNRCGNPRKHDPYAMARIMAGMSGYTPDDAAMTHGDIDPYDAELKRQRRTMNRMHARKDELLDLFATPLPDAARRRLTSELADLKRDITAARYSSDDRLWLDMSRKWASRH